jgi:hypothetical protein
MLLSEFRLCKVLDAFCDTWRSAAPTFSPGCSLVCSINEQQHAVRLALSRECFCAVQQGDTSCRLDGASLQQLLQMADQQQVSTSHQLALLHSLQPNMPGRIVSGFSLTMLLQQLHFGPC